MSTDNEVAEDEVAVKPFTISVVKGQLGGTHCWLGWLNIRQLHAVAKIDEYDINIEYGDPRQGYQREDLSTTKTLAKYFEEEEKPLLPTIQLAGKEGSIQEVSEDVLLLDPSKPLTVCDGGQRWRQIIALSDKDSVFPCQFAVLSRAKTEKAFVTAGLTSKRLTRNIMHHVACNQIMREQSFGDMSGNEVRDHLAFMAARKLLLDPKSLWYQNLNWKEKYKAKQISQSEFAVHLVAAVGAMECYGLIDVSLSIDQQVTDIAKVVEICWQAVAKSCPKAAEEWDDHSPLFTFHTRTLNEIFAHVIHNVALENNISLNGERLLTFKEFNVESVQDILSRDRTWLCHADFWLTPTKEEEEEEKQQPKRKGKAQNNKPKPPRAFRHKALIGVTEVRENILTNLGILNGDESTLWENPKRHVRMRRKRKKPTKQTK